ncbi:MAG: hypothetical protein ABJC05_04075 [Pyrinomonadaceae bacterium]
MKEDPDSANNLEFEKESKLRAYLQSEAASRTGQLVIGAVAIGIVFWWLQFSTQSICCGDFDGYYHIKWSRLLWEGIRNRHFPPAFTWLPLTSLNAKSYVDHHLLFHLLQMPFTWFGDLRLGAKIAATIFASLAVFSCYWLIVRYRISYALVWLVALLACSAPFLYRLNMAKAPPFAIIYLVLGIYLLFEEKYRLLVPLAFVFALTYDLFVLLGLAVVIWVAIIGWTERRFEWRPLLWVVVGSLAGLIINPYFPHNLYLLYEHFIIKVTAAEFSTKVGQEWYPYDTKEFLLLCFVAFVAMLAGYIAFDGSDRKRSARPLFFLIFSTALMIMTMRWKRFAEYWPPFAVLFAAFSLQSVFLGVRSAIGRLPSDVLNELEPFLDRQEPTKVAAETERKELIQTIKAGAVAIALGVVLFFNLAVTAKDIGQSARRDYYQAGMAWVRANVPPGEMVFNTDWDDFPRLFYYDPTHVYVTGLDPTYLLDKSPELSRLYERITLGKEKDPGPLIRDRFKARYVFSDNTNDHDEFYTNAMDSGWFDRVYEDDDCTVLHIRDQKGEPPPDTQTDEPDTGPDNQNDEDNSP